MHSTLVAALLLPVLGAVAQPGMMRVARSTVYARDSGDIQQCSQMVQSEGPVCPASKGPSLLTGEERCYVEAAQACGLNGDFLVESLQAYGADKENAQKKVQWLYAFGSLVAPTAGALKDLAADVQKGRSTDEWSDETKRRIQAYTKANVDNDPKLRSFVEELRHQYPDQKELSAFIQQSSLDAASLVARAQQEQQKEETPEEKEEDRAEDKAMQAESKKPGAVKATLGKITGGVKSFGSGFPRRVRQAKTALGRAARNFGRTAKKVVVRSADEVSIIALTLFWGSLNFGAVVIADVIELVFTAGSLVLGIIVAILKMIGHYTKPFYYQYKREKYGSLFMSF